MVVRRLDGVYVYCFTHIECYSDCSRRVCWYVCCYVRKKVLLQWLCNYIEDGYGPV